MASYSIKDLENLSGIKAHTIRIWEKRYNLILPKRTSTNIRYYDDNDLKKILNISILNRNGLKISRIAQMRDEELKEKINLLSRDPNGSSNHMEKLIISMIELDEQKFESYLIHSIMRMGIEDTFTKIIYPFFKKVGVMWQTGSVNPAQEHFISNLVRRKLITAIDSQGHNPEHNNKRFLLFLPEGEMHELGLLFCYYLLKKRGYFIIYLGQSVPFNDLKLVRKIKNFDYIVTTFYHSKTPNDLAQFVKKLSSSFNDKQIFIFGDYPSKVISETYANLKLLSDATQIETFIEN